MAVKVWDSFESPPGILKEGARTRVKNVTLRLKSESGRIFRKKVEKLTLATLRDRRRVLEDEDLPFRTGDDVCYIKGTNYASNITKGIEYPRRCVICGYYEEPDEGKCSKCGHTLIVDK